MCVQSFWENVLARTCDGVSLMQWALLLSLIKQLGVSETKQNTSATGVC